MCGIVGIVYRDGHTVPEKERLHRSMELLRHRGPDMTGSHAEPGVAFGHTRLSLVDLSERGRQPLWDAGQRYCLVYNGEVYNFRELRAGLEQRGVEFVTGTDTEVVLQLLIADGVEETLACLEGMFAFAFYDARERTLVLARDRFGIKPLSVYDDGEIFVFASEIKAMRPWVDLDADPMATTSYLLGFPGPTQNECFYDGVRIVPPGSVIRLQVGGESETRSFHQLTDMLDPDMTAELGRLSAEQIVDRADELLQRSVSAMLFADAPVGALCSGGVDSSLLLAMAARSRPVAIFHADVKGRWSEYDAALALSRHLDLELETVEVHDQDFIDLIPDVMYHFEHPFSYHLNSIPFLMVSRLVRSHGVKGLLSGEGADECFLGYQFLSQEPVTRRLETARDKVGRVLRMLPMIGNSLWPAKDSVTPAVAGMLNHYERELGEDALRAGWESKLGVPADWNWRTLRLLSYHLRTLLHRNDCLGMSASIEARFPFLDEQLVSFAVNLPHRYKIKVSPLSLEKEHPFVRDKWVVRKVADRYLPRALSRRKKMGFPTTAFQRIRIPASYFRDSFVQHHFRLSAPEMEYCVAHSDQPLRIRLLMLDAWGRVCLRSETRADVRTRLQQHLSLN